MSPLSANDPQRGPLPLSASVEAFPPALTPFLCTPPLPFSVQLIVLPLFLLDSSQLNNFLPNLSHAVLISLCWGNSVKPTCLHVQDEDVHLILLGVTPSFTCRNCHYSSSHLRVWVHCSNVFRTMLKKICEDCIRRMIPAGCWPSVWE